MPGRIVIVFAGAPLEPTPHLLQRLHAFDDPLVVAADSGATSAAACGFIPHLAIGDFDSLDPAGRDQLRQNGVALERFPRDKDATDGALAIQRALEESPTGLIIVGFTGGVRLDQTVANLGLLATLPGGSVILDGRNEGRILRGRGRMNWEPEPGELVSLVPFWRASGVRTAGLRWLLQDDHLTPGSTRGISNEPVGGTIVVSLRSGTLLVLRHFVAT